MAHHKPLVAVTAALAGAGWWAVLGLALDSGHSAVEDAAVVGGWSLSLLPVHVTARSASATASCRRGAPTRHPGGGAPGGADCWKAGRRGDR